MTQVTIMWALTAVNIIVFLIWEFKYRALFRAYSDLLKLLLPFMRSELDKALKDVKKLAEELEGKET